MVLSSAPTQPQPDELTIKIDGEIFRHWRTSTIRTSMDSFWTASFTAPFEPKQAGFRRRFRPFSFADVDILLGGKDFLKATMLTPIPRFNAKASWVEVPCYARPAVIMDCVSPDGGRDFNGFNLVQITEALLEPWGFDLQVDGDPGPAFEEVAIERAQKVGDFLVDLCKQRGFLLSNTQDGKVWLNKPTTGGRAKYAFQQGEEPLGEVTMTPRPQEYWSEITGTTPAKSGREGAEYTLDNEHLDKLRPMAMELQDTDDADCLAATYSLTGRMLAGAASYSWSKMPTWLYPNGTPILAGDDVMVEASRAMIYQPYNFKIRESVLTASKDSKTCSANLVIPEAFTGELPKRMPWDE